MTGQFDGALQNPDAFFVLSESAIITKFEESAKSYRTRKPLNLVPCRLCGAICDIFDWAEDPNSSARLHVRSHRPEDWHK